MPPSDPESCAAYYFTVNVTCKTKDGRHFLVVMQNDFRDDYHMKALLKCARTLSRLRSEQNAKDENHNGVNSNREFWKNIQGIYAIVLTNKALDVHRMNGFYQEEPLMEPNLVNTNELCHVNELTRHNGDTPHQLVLLMLANLRTDHLSKSFSPIEKWAYVFKDTNMCVRRISTVMEIEDSDIIEEDPAIKEFVERLDVDRIPSSVRDNYIVDINYYNDSIVDIEEKAFEKGFTEGFQEAFEEGFKKGFQETFEEGFTEGFQDAQVKERKKGLLIGARALKIEGTMTNAQISGVLDGDVTEDEVAATKID
jgi:hypothetical protein